MRRILARLEITATTPATTHGTLDTLRSGCHNNPVVYSVVDDQLYDWGKNCKMEDENLRKQALVYTVRASDIFYSVARAEMQL